LQFGAHWQLRQTSQAGTLSLGVVMTYRNGTYIAFHANGEREPTESDMKYYNLLCAWKLNERCELSFVNSHEKTSAIRDASKRETVRRALTERLRNSKNMVLIIGKTTREDRDWVPLEIAYAIDTCEIPIIAASQWSHLGIVLASSLGATHHSWNSPRHSCAF